MKKYRWVLTAVFAAFLAGTSGCGKKTETIPITTISQSTDDDDPEDNLAASGDSDEIPEYDVNSHLILVAEKYASMTSPVFFRKLSI